jgi:hypothetical protein
MKTGAVTLQADAFLSSTAFLRRVNSSASRRFAAARFRPDAGLPASRRALCKQFKLGLRLYFVKS